MRYSNRGIGTYTRNLIRGLLEIDEENEYVLLTIKGVSFPEKSALESQPNVRMFGVPIPGTNFYSVWVFDRLLLSTIIRALKADVIHFPSYEVTDAYLDRTVITVHDLIGFKERLHRGVDALVSRNQLAHFARCVKGASNVMAVSNSTREDLVDILDVPRDLISVAYPGIDPLFAPINDEESLSRMRRQLGIGEKHLLYAGSCARNKRVDLIIRAYSRLDDATKKDCQLVMCGFVSRELEALAADLHLSDHVVFAGIVSRDTVSALYNSAAVVLFPSDAEGFGLPVLEAMACGTPVIATNIASLVEVGGDAVLFVERGDEAQLSKAIATLLENPHLRSEMSQRGLVRAKGFSWKQTATQTLKVYESVANQRA